MIDIGASVVIWKAEKGRQAKGEIYLQVPELIDVEKAVGSISSLDSLWYLVALALTTVGPVEIASLRMSFRPTPREKRITATYWQL